jgi:hypothetical protein
MPKKVSKEADRKWQNYVQCTGCGRYKVEGSSNWVGYGPMGPQDVNSMGYMRCKEKQCGVVRKKAEQAAKARKSN